MIAITIHAILSPLKKDHLSTAFKEGLYNGMYTCIHLLVLTNCSARMHLFTFM